LPNQTNSILFLAAHNGNSPVSYFKNLEKLTKNSKIYLFYNGIKYEYLIDTFYTVSKIGKVSINNDKAKTTIVLISCKNNSDTEQVVYIGYLERKVEY
jgi:LPXTG-site transpeptidase (sortase) family protein